MDLKMMELETKIAELELEIMKWNKDIEDIQLGLTFQMDQQLENLNNLQKKKEKEIKNIKKELIEKIENDLSKNDKNQIVSRIEYLSKEVLSYKERIDNLKCDIKKLEESNRELSKEQKEIRDVIDSMRKETKETRAKTLMLITVIVCVIFSQISCANMDIQGIKRKIIREHGYGVMIDTDKYMI